MASMSFTEARIALEQFSRANQAAVRLGEALETATDLEKKLVVLTANVEHLSKEQVERQQNLDDIGRRAATLQTQTEKDHDALMTALTKKRQAVMDGIGDTQRAEAERKKAEDAGFAAYCKAHYVETQKMLAEKAALEASIKTLTKQADEIKEKMRKFVS